MERGLSLKCRGYLIEVPRGEGRRQERLWRGHCELRVARVEYEAHMGVGGVELVL
jgi:hypothetical protein